MSKLEGLKSKGKVYNIGGVDFVIHPLGIDDMDMLDMPDDVSVKESFDATIKLVTKVLQMDDPSITEDEVRKFVKLDHIKEFQDAIMDVCGMKDTNTTGRQKVVQERLDALRKAREARQAQANSA